MSQAFEYELRVSALRISIYLEGVLSSQMLPGEQARPKRLLEAMRHGALSGGKRLRPFLVVQSAALFGVSEAQALATAGALECLHCYSLIHDDLPAMDNDNLRRGKPTVHKAFDDATAILAGDALLTLAFDLITDPTLNPDAEIRAELAHMLARAAGHGGMIGGQMLDIAAETTAPDEAGIRLLQSMKTGALLRFACEAGAVLGKASPPQRAAMADYGKAIGLAFQLADDLLDETATSEEMGKATGKDATRGKGTLVAIHGAEKVRSMLEDLIQQAEQALQPFGEDADTLRATARFIIERKN